MKKFIYAVIAAALCLCSCKVKVPQQDPAFKLSEEQGKMLNLLVYLYNYETIIDFDTSSDNYVCTVYYSDFNSKKVERFYIDNMKFCDGIISDINQYTYSRGNTYNNPDHNLHARWNSSSVKIYKYGDFVRYPLLDENSLKAQTNEPDPSFGLEIRKVSDGKYFYREFDMNGYGGLAGLGATAYDGDKYIESDILEGDKKIFKVMRFWNQDQSLVCRIYLDGWLKRDNQYKKEYVFDTPDMEKGTYYHTYDGVEHRSRVSRKYDEEGRLIYNEEIKDDGTAVVMRISKTVPDVKLFSPAYENPIDIENAIEDYGY